MKISGDFLALFLALFGFGLYLIHVNYFSNYNIINQINQRTLTISDVYL